MTKTIKKSFVVVLMLVMSLFFALAVGTGYSSASAADEDKTAAQVFIENVETFKTTVTEQTGFLPKKYVIRCLRKTKLRCSSACTTTFLLPA